MKWVSHLSLRAIEVRHGSEWRHDQPGWCFVRIVGGYAYWLSKEAPVELAAGHILIIPPDAEGVIRASLISPLQMEAFLWRPDNIHGILTLAERHFFAAKAGAIIRSYPPQSEVAQAFAVATSGRGQETNLVERSLLLRVVTLAFCSEINAQSLPNVESPAAAERFTKLMQALSEDDLLNHTGHELALRCGCSVRHFDRLFQERFGMPLRKRQIMLRLNKVARLLVETDEKIVKIATSNGFRNVGLFNLMFKKYKGMTPTQWREQSRME